MNYAAKTHAAKTFAAEPQRRKMILSLPRPMLDFWRATDRELFSLTKKMITRAEAELEQAESAGNAKRSQLLRAALDFATMKLQAVTSGAVSGTDVCAELRQALNVLLNSIYLVQKP